MRYRMLGQNGLKVSVLSFGAWQIGDPNYWGPDSQANANAAVQSAIDGGINLFDTAEMYGEGESERALGKALGKRRPAVLIATKVSPEHCEPMGVRGACEASLQRLGTDYIDLYQVHWPVRHTPFEVLYEQLDSLRQEGKIREIGVSNFGSGDLANWFSVGSAISNQIGYNIAFRAPEYAVLPACRKFRAGTLIYMPLMQGLLAGRWKSIDEIPRARRRTRHFSGRREGTRHGERGCESLLMETLTALSQYAQAIGIPLPTLCLCWLVAQPGVTSAVIGARNAAQVRRNLQAGDLDLGPAAIAHLNELTWPLKSRLGTNADMWESTANSRLR